MIQPPIILTLNLREEEVLKNNRQVFEKLGFELIDFSVYADIKAVPPRYQYFLEIGKNEGERSADAIRAKLEEELGKASPAMKNRTRN